MKQELIAFLFWFLLAAIIFFGLISPILIEAGKKIAVMITNIELQSPYNTLATEYANIRNS